MIRRTLVGLRDLLDKQLHTYRHRRAAARIREIAPTSILFICLGNVCRSPYAEAATTLKAGRRFEITSAGFIGPGRSSPESAQAAATRRSVSLAEHRSKTVTSEMLGSADLVFIFDRFNLRRLRACRGARLDRTIWLGDLDPAWAGRRAIQDPWGRGAADFDVAYERIDRCVQRLLDVLDGAPQRTDSSA